MSQIQIDGRRLTEVTLTRSRATLMQIPSAHAGATSLDGMERLLRPLVGGTVAELRYSIDTLIALRLIELVDGQLSRTPQGDRVVRKLRRGDTHELALVLIRSGAFADQIRLLLATARKTGGGLACPSMAARRVAPQLVGVLYGLVGVEGRGTILLSTEVAAELESPWNLWGIPPMAVPGSPEERQQVGDLAELYSLKLEQSAYLGASQYVLWISRDDPNAGFDIEVVRPAPSRCIEVKGSRGRGVGFFISSNEMKKARSLGDRYEIHYWGDIRLGPHPSAEYERLRTLGYPVVIRDPSAMMVPPEWSLEPTEYRAQRLL